MGRYSDINTLCDGIQALKAIKEDHANEDNGVLKSVLVEIFEDCRKDFGAIVGVSSDFTLLDQLTCGIKDSDFIITIFASNGFGVVSIDYDQWCLARYTRAKLHIL